MKLRRLQKQREPKFPLLYSWQGFRYRDLLLSQGKVQEVTTPRREGFTNNTRWRAEFPASYRFGLSFTQVVSLLLQLQHGPNQSITKSTNFLNRAVDVLRQASTQHMLPLSLLARVELYRVTDALEKARKDLDEAMSIATHGGMRLHLADCHLEYARLYLAKGDKNEALKHWETAKKMIEEMGYHRRDKEVQELEEQVK